MTKREYIRRLLAELTERQAVHRAKMARLEREKRELLRTILPDEAVPEINYDYEPPPFRTQWIPGGMSRREYVQRLTAELLERDQAHRARMAELEREKRELLRTILPDEAVPNIDYSTEPPPFRTDMLAKPDAGGCENLGRD